MVAEKPMSRQLERTAMKKLTIFFALIFLTCLTFSASAQINFGVKVGGNLSDIQQNYKDSDWEMPTKLKVGFHIGFTSDIPISDMFSFQPGLLFTTKGYSMDLDKMTDKDDNTDVLEIDGYGRASLNYLELPLNIAFKINSFQIYAGPYLALGLSGKAKEDYIVSYPGGNITVKEDTKIKPVFGEVKKADQAGDEGFISAFDYGLNFGLGYMAGPILIQGGYSLGLGNATPKYEGWFDIQSSDYRKSNRVITLSVSYFFGD